MDDTDLSTPMLARIRNHMLLAITGFAVGIAVIALGRVLGGVLFGAAIPGWWVGLSFVLGALTIPVIGIGSAFRILRCPGCNGLVAFQVNGQASPFAARYSRQCRHCGKTIFDGRLTRRMRIVQVVVFFGTILFFGGLSVMRGGH
jgi:hypothetical protein